MNKTQLQLYPTQAKTGLEWATRLWGLGEIQSGKPCSPFGISLATTAQRVAHSSPVLA